MLAKLAFENPILAREIRTRMRGARALWLLFLYVAILAIFLFITYLIWWSSVQGDLSGQTMGGASVIGKTFYSVLFTVQACLVALITPSLTSGGITIEKEQRTFELLTASLLPRIAIVFGKLLSAVAFAALLLTASLPLVSLSFLLGGVSPVEVIVAYGLLLVTSFLYGTVGIACSSVAKNTTTSTVMTYGAIFVIFFTTLPLAVMALPGAVSPALSGPSGIGLTALNPLGALTATNVAETYFGIVIPAWAVAVVINGLFGLILALVAVHRLDFPRTDRSGVLRLLTALLVGLLAFCIYGLFLPGSNFFGGGETGLVLGGWVTLFALVPLIPLFATADDLPERGVRTLILPRHLARGEAPSGLLFVLLLVLLCGAVAYLGLTFGVGNNVPQGTQFDPARAESGVFFITLLGLATTWGFGGLGVFFSALTRNRWSALALTGGVMVILYLIPLSAGAFRGYSDDPQARFGDNVLYFSPLAGLPDLAKDMSRDSPWQRTVDSLLFAPTPLYLVSSVLYFLLGTFFLAAAQWLHRRQEWQRLQKRAALEAEPEVSPSASSR